VQQSLIRNFCIIAHIDHGKSTLADRLIEVTGAVPQREQQEQLLDTMDLERERGITIKAQAIRLSYKARDGQTYELNLIDTPGHVDFSYEVSRSLAACEGALLLVDATQGIQAQTLANIYLALEHDLAIIPIVNKVDLPQAVPEQTSDEIQNAFGFKRDEILFASGKTGKGVDEVLEAIVTRVGPPTGDAAAPLRALIFDSKYDPYKGVVAYVRLMEGAVKENDRIRLMGTKADAEVLEVGYFSPQLRKAPSLSTGQVGYVATGLKNVRECRVGDTMTLMARPAAEALPGYKPLKPMVFTGIYPADGQAYPELREALEKLQLNDSALQFEPESSAALGFGFRCGFLGLLHMDVVQERLEREYSLNLIATAPSVSYMVKLTDGREHVVDNPSKLPEPQKTDEIREPWVNVTIISPARFIGPIMELVTGRRGEYVKMEYLQPRQAAQENEDREGAETAGRDARVLLEYNMPLSEMLVDFHDQLKSRTQGYASMDYSVTGHKAGDLVKLDVLVNFEPVDALSLILHRSNAAAQGRELVSRLRDLIPRQMFEVPVQAAIGGKVIARETVRAMRKDVLAKCYGGDITRKRKLLEKQSEGKKRMKKVGRVEVPQEAFMAVLKLTRD